MLRIFKFLKTSSTKKTILLFVVAILLILLILGFIFYNFSFLISSFNKALGTVLEPTVATGFDIEGFEKLNLIKK